MTGGVDDVPVTMMTCPVKSGIWSTVNLDLGGKNCKMAGQGPLFFHDAPPIVRLLDIISLSCYKRGRIGDGKINDRGGSPWVTPRAGGTLTSSNASYAAPTLRPGPGPVAFPVVPVSPEVL